MSLPIDYYSDLLCVWAWIAQKRVEELGRQWDQQVTITNRFVDVFGDAHGRLQKQWQDRGGFEGFAEHVEAAAAPYDTAPVNPAIWRQVRPTSSLPAHLLIKAAELVSGSPIADRLALALRHAFFVDARDISHRDTLIAIAAEQQIDVKALRQRLDDGRAMAALMADYQQARAQNLQGSPCWIMNEGRQTLYGNVGYRVLSANVEELLKHPADEACWC
ncbi:DsbA family oxidoreductase [Motiliproteus sediminis]|uniref:DsbA family oxidoreductase n=1 Tax=Motiliproteus sediminis TaxID=1468178 RepID=UPI001AEFD518|nr:DsbA family protein [Motiliproteus sediminis]